MLFGGSAASADHAVSVTTTPAAANNLKSPHCLFICSSLAISNVSTLRPVTLRCSRSSREPRRATARISGPFILRGSPEDGLAPQDDGHTLLCRPHPNTFRTDTHSACP